MTIKKFSGKTREEAIESAKEELGPSVVIMNVKEIRSGGLFGVFRKSTYEVTGAIEDDAVFRQEETPDTLGRRVSYAARPSEQPEQTAGNFSAMADERIEIPPIREPETQFAQLPVSPPSAPIQHQHHEERRDAREELVSRVNPDDLRSAFREVGAVIGQKIPVSSVTDYDPAAPVIHAKQIDDNALLPPEKPKSNVDELPRVETISENFSGQGREKSLGFVRMLYNALVDHEVDEKYVNLILDDLGKLIASGSSLDYLISSVYQKMILKLGKPKTIAVHKKPTVVFLVGSTGVGKTTTIAKIASRESLSSGKQIAFLTADTYRIGATEQLDKYAQILGIPFSVIYSPEEIGEEIGKFKDKDLILVDTVGFSHKNLEQKEYLNKLISSVPKRYDKEVYLALSATTKYQDLKAIVDTYRTFTKFSLIFTKLDETTYYGNIYNIRQYSGAQLSYITNGQNVPDDFAVLDSQRLVMNLLGGQSN